MNFSVIKVERIKLADSKHQNKPIGIKWYKHYEFVYFKHFKIIFSILDKVVVQNDEIIV